MQQDDPVGRVFLSLCEAVDTPVSLSAWLRYRYSHGALVELEINPRDYTSHDAFSIDYAVSTYLSKYVGLQTNIDLEAVALSKFTSSEITCRETNRRLKTEQPPQEISGILHAAQRKIALLLGRFSVFAVSDAFGWGPGATHDLPRSRAFLDTKMCEMPISVSKSAAAMLQNSIALDLHWLEAIRAGLTSSEDKIFSYVDTCRITTVPKNAKTNRVIAIEPTGNLFLQKGFGAFIRYKLRSVGVNLNDQTRNQQLACQAISRSLATLDLRAASDTVSKEIVWSLLPYEWASAMDAVRSRKALMPDGSVISLEKFSSMGNGFTFELESLIFWAIAQATVDSLDLDDGVVSVYGDDIIVNSAAYDLLVSTLNFAGFAVNEAKSFKDGLFFESCGKHYFAGRDCTPAYQKEVPVDDLSVIRLGNRLLRLADRLGTFGFDSRIKSAWRQARKISASSLAYWSPYDLQGDDSWSLPRAFFPDTFWRQEGYKCPVLKGRTRSYPANERALLAWSLRRGVVTGSPFLGDLSRDAGSQPARGHRWIIPSGHFGKEFE
jgi:hypothetical protein